MGLSGSNTRPIDGFLAALIQFPVPRVEHVTDILNNVREIVRTIHSTKAGYPGLDLIVFPEYSTQGLNTAKWTEDWYLDTVPGMYTDVYAKACKEEGIYGVFSILEKNPDDPEHPFNSAVMINPEGEIVLHYRKLFPWTPIEPWAPGNYGMPVADGPAGSKIALCICHDGMFPELAREAAYQGANVLIRISGYSTQVNDQWILTNRSNAWHNLMYTLSVNLAGYDGTFYYFGEGQAVQPDGTTYAQGQRNPWEIVTAEVYPKVADNARKTWGLENNIYDLGHRAFVAVEGGERKTGLQYITDLANGEYRLPWEEEVEVTDGSSYGYR